ncbi:Uma2 family endonuclease [Streptomyces sp. B6B3]|uniref:Uma2 family endonuclease n=1 Tax=Streptomyces sp. B6B3 TaxID=3153570 RepID=UPI00325D68C8
MTVLDDIWWTIEHTEFPEGYKVEVIEGQIVLTPQNEEHSDITWAVVQQAVQLLGEGTKFKTDVPIEFPGYRNTPAPDVTFLDDTAERGETGRYVFLDVDIAVEIVSPSSIRNDYEVKRQKYAHAGIPTYLIIDPLQGRCTLLTEPGREDYKSEQVLPFGETVELRRRDGRPLPLDTSGFPRS